MRFFQAFESCEILILKERIADLEKQVEEQMKANMEVNAKLNEVNQ